jgi:Pseudouridine synthase II TruB, C-terminal
MVSLEQLEAAGKGGAGVAGWPLLHADRAVAHLPPLRLGAADALALRCGRIVALAATGSQSSPAGRWRLYDEEGGFLGLGVSSIAGELRVQRLFSSPLPV